jgi:hypothetical protein
MRKSQIDIVDHPVKRSIIGNGILMENHGKINMWLEYRSNLLWNINGSLMHGMRKIVEARVNTQKISMVVVAGYEYPTC